jgi:glutamate transport system permease protein
VSAVLFDAQGPIARRRAAIGTVAAAVAAAALLGWVLWKLYKEGEFEAELWEDLAQPNIARAIWTGLVGTLAAAAVAIVLSVVFGGLMAVARLSDHAVIRGPAFVVVEFFRAVPLLLLIMFLFIGFSDILNAYWALVLALMLYNGSVLAEVFRAGINAVPRGQSEAAYSIGMRKSQVMSSVLLPQAVAIMLPAIVSQLVVVLKDTALGVIIAYGDLVYEANGIAQFVRHTIVPLTLAALIFIAINYSLSRLAVWLEARFARRGRTSVVEPGAPVDMQLAPTRGGAGD